MTDVTGHTEVKMGSERGFGLVFAIFFAIISLWPVVFGSGGLRIWALIVAAVFLGLAYLLPNALKPLNRVWFLFGMFLSKIVTPITMGIIFFLSVVPIGIVRRMTTPDPLKQKFDPDADSYWIERDPEQLALSSMKKQY